MRDLEALQAQVTLREYETGRDLFFQLRDNGVPTNKAAGMVYRAGFSDGKQAAKDRAGREIGRLHDVIRELKQSPPKATAEAVRELDSATSAELAAAEQEEGSTDHE